MEGLTDLLCLVACPNITNTAFIQYFDIGVKTLHVWLHKVIVWNDDELWRGGKEMSILEIGCMEHCMNMFLHLYTWMYFYNNTKRVVLS